MVVVVLDDVGFADFGCYGSEIDTPTIDRLAAGGLRYTGFHTTPLCSPTRACLLTGRNHHSVGMSMVAEWDAGFPSARSRITPAAATLAQILRDVGYATLHVGKWHLAPPHEQTQVGPFHNWPLARASSAPTGSSRATPTSSTPTYLQMSDINREFIQIAEHVLYQQRVGK